VGDAEALLGADAVLLRAGLLRGGVLVDGLVAGGGVLVGGVLVGGGVGMVLSGGMLADALLEVDALLVADALPLTTSTGVSSLAGPHKGTLRKPRLRCRLRLLLSARLIRLGRKGHALALPVPPLGG
jgi:hypothetical protein